MLLLKGKGQKGKNLQYFSLVHAHKPEFFCDYPFLTFFLAFFFLFSRPFLFHCLLRCTFYLAAVKSLVLIILSNYRYSGSCYHHFCTETDSVHQFALSECVRCRKSTVVWIDLYYGSSAKWISRISGNIKLNWWRHKWYRELDRSGRNMYVVDTQRLTFRWRRDACRWAYSWPATDWLWLMSTGICRHW